MSIFDSIFNDEEEEVPGLTDEELAELEWIDSLDNDGDDWYRDWLESLTDPDEEEE